MAIHRIYSETLSFAEVRAPRTLSLLRRFRLELVLAVRPWQLVEVGPVASALADAGVPISIWPMLSDAEGRWANVHNAAAFASLVHRTCDALDAVGAPPTEVFLDLEPSFSDAHALAPRGEQSRLEELDLRARALTRAFASLRSGRAFARAAEGLALLVRDVRARGLRVGSAVWPLVALDPPGGSGWQALLGTPVDPVLPDRVSVMMYTSILEGWSRGAVRRRDARALLALATARVRSRWGGVGGLSIGCVGTGAFDDEPVYRAPSELAEDACSVRALGCTDLSLFDLGGVLTRGEPEAWLDAFTRDNRSLEPSVAPPRVRLAQRLARWATLATRWIPTTSDRGDDAHPG